MRRILLTNDDGLYAEGLRAARELLERLGEVTVVVPDREMSGASHALTLNHPLRIQPVGPRAYVVNGTPTDCVNLALNRLLAERPDLVFSGINRGLNIGLDVTYSGTVAGAYEGAIQGVKAVAVSIEAAGDLSRPEIGARLGELLERVLDSGRQAQLLNVNLPAGDIRGTRLTCQGRGGFRTEIIEKLDPRGNRYYWIGGEHAHETETRPSSDIGALRDGFISVTPLTLDQTDYPELEDLARRWPAGEPVIER